MLAKKRRKITVDTQYNLVLFYSFNSAQNGRYRDVKLKQVAHALTLSVQSAYKRNIK